MCHLWLDPRSGSVANGPSTIHLCHPGAGSPQGIRSRPSVGVSTVLETKTTVFHYRLNDSITRPATPGDQNLPYGSIFRVQTRRYSADFRPNRPQLGSNSSVAAPNGSVDTDFTSQLCFWPAQGPRNGQISRSSLSGREVF